MQNVQYFGWVIMQYLSQYSTQHLSFEWFIANTDKLSYLGERMLTLVTMAQTGVISDPNSFAEYLTFVLADDSNTTTADLADAIAQVGGIEKSLLQKDPNSNLTISIGISASAWQQVFPAVTKPTELRPFTALADGDRRFPATAGDLFVMIKSERMDINFQAAKYIANLFAPYATLIEDIQGFKYLDNRDLIDFVDGTENPKLQARINAVLVDSPEEDSIHHGGSYLTVQRYVDRRNLWDKQTTEQQEKVIGRTKLDNIELNDSEKPAWAHNAKSKVEIDGEEIAMFRQNRPFGNAMEHGTMFVGFAKSASVIETSLKQMIIADDNGDYDHLLDFVEAKTGNQYFMPSKTLLNSLGED